MAHVHSSRRPHFIHRTLLIAVALATVVGCHPTPETTMESVGPRAAAKQVGAHATPVGPTVHPSAPGAIELLDGRWIATFPIGARVRPRIHDLMSAPAPTTDETRVIIDAGDERMVAFALERYHTVHADLAADVRADQMPRSATERNADLSPFALADHRVRAMMYTWHPRNPGDSVLVNTVYVVSEDNTAQVVKWYANGTAWASGCTSLLAQVGLPTQGGCSSYALSLSRTLRPGPRPRLATQGGLQILPHSPLAATLPPGWAATAEVGDDFSVVRIHEIIPFPTSERVLSAYVGDHPHTVIPDGVNARASAGLFLGAPATWYTWETPIGGGLTDYHMACQQQFPGHEDTIVQVFALAFDPAARAQMRAMAETFRAAPPRHW